MTTTANKLRRRESAFAIEKEINARVSQITGRMPIHRWLSSRCDGMQRGCTMEYVMRDGEWVVADFDAEELMAYRNNRLPETEAKIQHVVGLVTLPLGAPKARKFG